MNTLCRPSRCRFALAANRSASAAKLQAANRDTDCRLTPRPSFIRAHKSSSANWLGPPLAQINELLHAHRNDDLRFAVAHVIRPARAAAFCVRVRPPFGRFAFRADDAVSDF